MGTITSLINDPHTDTHTERISTIGINLSVIYNPKASSRSLVLQRSAFAGGPAISEIYI